VPTKDHVYGGVPPVAVSVLLYSCNTFATGNGFVVVMPSGTTQLCPVQAVPVGHRHWPLICTFVGGQGGAAVEGTQRSPFLAVPGGHWQRPSIFTCVGRHSPSAGTVTPGVAAVMPAGAPGGARPGAAPGGVVSFVELGDAAGTTVRVLALAAGVFAARGGGFGATLTALFWSARSAAMVAGGTMAEAKTAAPATAAKNASVRIATLPSKSKR
jgi:hypothetical protein